MIFNILTIFNWTTWLIICLVIILIFWIIYGGREEYEFIGVRPLQSPDLVEIFYKEPKENVVETPDIILPNGHVKSTKGEEIVADVLEEILQRKVKRNIRPTFLRNPESGKCLELDCYDPHHKIAVEYNGIQHYKFPSPFHQTEQEFQDQLYRDRLKKKLCDENNIYLIPVPYWVDTCMEDPDDPDGEMICTNNVSKNLRYARIYEYLTEKLKEYFYLFSVKEENEKKDNFDEWANDDTE